MPSLWTFALPPSVSPQSTQAMALRGALGPLGCGFIAPSQSYEDLTDMLIRGDVHVAWAPPMVAARVERAGGTIVLQAVRGGTASYRSALFARRGLTLSPQSLMSKRAAWVDRRSVAGYLFPTSLLRGAGIDPYRVFREHHFLGSFQACVDEVLDGRADVSGCFASTTAARTSRVGFMSLAGNRLQELCVLAYSSECPHDGIALSPSLSDEMAASIAEGLRKLTRDPELTQGMDAESFELPAPGTYRDILKLVADE